MELFFQLAKIVYRLQFIKLVHNDFFLKKLTWNLKYHVLVKKNASTLILG